MTACWPTCKLSCIPVGMSSSNNASVTNVILEHVWVEAAIDYIPSGGRYMVEADTWVALDAGGCIWILIMYPVI